MTTDKIPTMDHYDLLTGTYFGEARKIVIYGNLIKHASVDVTGYVGDSVTEEMETMLDKFGSENLDSITITIVTKYRKPE
jgi:hypothetical protein